MTIAEKTVERDQGSIPTLQVNGEVATVQWNRPDVHNRFQAIDLATVMHLLDEVNRNTAIRVLIFSGTGKTFSSGFDLREFEGKFESESHNPVLRFEAMIEAIEHARPITIARVQGPVYGGATDFILACDFSYAADHTEMFMPAAKIGLHYYPFGLRRWARRLGLQQAKRLFLTAEKISASEMHRIGFVDELHPLEQLDSAIQVRVTQLLAHAPQALEDTKRSLNECARGDFDYARFEARHTASLRSNDMTEALKARAEKRTPVFTRT